MRHTFILKHINHALYLCNDTVNIFKKHYMTTFNINVRFHCWDLKVPVVAETPVNI